VVERTANFWKTVGCRILTMSPAMHDRLVARSSHLPHAVASALVNAVVESAPEAIDVTGSGFRDTTRVAGGPEGMWTGIFMENRMEVLGAVREMQARLAEFSGYLEAQDTLGLEKFLLRARDVRKDLE
jgi:prephenate dehydrogenase